MERIISLYNKIGGQELTVDNLDFFLEFLNLVMTELDRIINNKGVINKIENVYHKFFDKDQMNAYNQLIQNIIEYQKYYSSLTIDPNTFIPFGDDDPRWLYAALIELNTFFVPRSKYFVKAKSNQNYVYPLEGNKIAIVGDFGSSDKYQTMVVKAIADLKPDLVIHLGDIYVAGTSSECTKYWETYKNGFEGSIPPLWNLIGNHEYISKGKGYFKKLIAPRLLGGGKQETSFFSLENPETKLQILALDTGYESTNFTLPVGGESMDYTTFLDDEQLAWAQARLQFAKDNGYRTVLMSHHQYYSAYWKDQQFNAKLGNQLLAVGQPISSWIFGHDHRSIVYPNTYGIVGKSICLGHGSMPITIGAYEGASPNFPYDQSFIPSLVSQYGTQLYNNGFVMMDQNLNADFYQVDRNTGECTKYNSMSL